MSALAMLAAAGVWPALPLTGYVLLESGTVPFSKRDCPAISSFAVASVAGMAVWSTVLLLAAVFGIFSGPAIGLLGWGVTAALAVLVARRGSSTRPAAMARSGEDDRAAETDVPGQSLEKATPAKRRKKKRAATPVPSRAPARSRAPKGFPGLESGWEAILAVGLVLAAVFYLGFPAESIYGGRDEGVYAMHGTWIARHGRLDVPYPWPADAHDLFAHLWVGFPGFYQTEPTMTAQFGQLFSVWLAQAYATLGPDGLFRLNAVFSVLFLGVFYGLGRTVLPASYAAAATLLLAFNPSQLWVSRITLSEIQTQLFIWTGLLCLVEALRFEDRALARWAGAFFGLSAFVRFDSMLLLPLLFLGHLAARAAEPPTPRSTSVWTAFYQTALPAFALAVGYYALFSAPYMMKKHYLSKLINLYVVSAGALLVARPVLLAWVRPLVRHRVSLAMVGLSLLALAAWAYWIRPFPDDPARVVRLWPGYDADPSRWGYGSETLVNLARYLSPPVIWLALAGWFVALWNGVRREGPGRALLPALVVCLGASLVYLYQPANTPDHFWAIRRFVPVVIPAFALCTAVGARWILERIPHPASTTLAAATALFLAAFTLHADRLILTFREDSGFYRQVADLARQLPADEPILAQGFTTWLTPLYVGFDRRVVPLNLGKPEVRAAAEEWIGRRSREGKPAYFVGEYGASAIPDSGPFARLADVRYTVLHRAELTRTFTESTIHPLPERIVTRQRHVVVQTLTRP